MFRIVGSVPATLALVLALQSAPASAQIFGAAAEPAQPPAPAVAAKPAESPLAYPIRLRISDVVAAAATERDKDISDQLFDFYTARGFEPIWLDGKGLNARAMAVVAEIGRAKEWGLDPSAFVLPATQSAGADAGALTNAEVQISLAVGLYASHARGGRVDPSQLSKWLDQKPKPIDLAKLLGVVMTTADAGAALRDLHPKHPGFQNLRTALLKKISPSAPTEPAIETLPPGPRIEPGQRHPDIAIVRRRLGIIGTAHEETLYDDRVVAAVRSYMKLGRRNLRPVIDERVRTALNNPPELVAKKADSIDAKKIVVNMERWRWLPDEIGDLHIWNSLTEFETKVVKSGEVLHQERIIVGKPDTQTPVFSHKLAYLVFQPEWGVPNSIKVKQLLPALQDGNYDILDERGMKILINGREKDPGDYNWEKTDIRYVPVYQLPGSSNPLGQVKFMFPNKHDVYMHDTPQKSLFNDSKRTYSHGCIRVRNPRKLAELIMNLDQGWGVSEVAAVLNPRAKPSNRVELREAIQVHNTYFTVMADAEGTVRSVPDIYNHDKRISDALDGVPVEVIAKRDPARVLEQELEEIAPTKQSDGSTITMKSKRERQIAAARRRSDDDELYESPRNKYQGYSALGYPSQGYYAPPKPVYYPPVKKGNNFRAPMSLYDVVNTYGR